MDKAEWIKTQEEHHLFSHDGDSSDADALLEHGITNRDIATPHQGRLLNVARIMSSATGVRFYSDLADAVERCQMNVDNQARRDYMKVAIEQWQGKLANAKKSVEALV
jgi:hypothetical protein